MNSRERHRWHSYFLAPNRHALPAGRPSGSENILMRHLKPQSTQSRAVDSGEGRMITSMRLVLAVAALVITNIDPTEPSRFATVTYTTLALYVLYSLALHLLTLRGRRFPVLLQYSLHWIDVVFYVALIGLSNGTNSIFFVLFFFCIIVASFRWGFGPGMRVTIVSVVLYVIVGYAARPPAPEFDLDRFILRTSALPVLGYMIAHWGGYELRLKQRLELLKEISTLSNPRFGIDRTLGANLERLRAFYNADLCMAVTVDSDDDRFYLRRATKKNPEAAEHPELVSEDLAKTLLSFREEEALCFRSGGFRRLWHMPQKAVKSDALNSPEHVDNQQCRTVAEILGASSFLTVPMRSHNRTMGRLFVACAKPAYKIADLDFLSQAVENIMPVLENVILVDRMATRAAEEERQRIARDIHDRIIQPYIGLQLGITSVCELCDLAPGENLVPLLRERVLKLQELAGAGVADLRRYVQGLKYGEGTNGGLTEGLRRYALRFLEVTGIEIEVRAKEGFHINDRLAAEVFSMAAEAMSNIRRHTRALQGVIDLATANDRLIVRVENEKGADTPLGPFVPRSITERAAALQGAVKVETSGGGGTAVVIEIPL
jgi:signal transduction histidine kinase